MKSVVEPWALALLVGIAGCLGPPGDAPSDASGDGSTSPPFSYPTTSDPPRPSGPVSLNGGANRYFIPTDLSGQEIVFHSGRVADWADEEVSGRLNYVLVWNRTGLAHYSEWGPKVDAETAHTIPMPPDPPYLLSFRSTTSVGYINATAPPGKYMSTRLETAVPSAPHPDTTDYLAGYDHNHTLRVSAGTNSTIVHEPVLPPLDLHWFGLRENTPHAGRVSVHDPLARDNTHYDVDLTGDVDPWYWGDVGMAGEWTMRLNLTLPAAQDVEWTLSHSLRFWSRDVAGLGFNWPDAYWTPEDA